MKRDVDCKVTVVVLADQSFDKLVLYSDLRLFLNTWFLILAKRRKITFGWVLSHLWRIGELVYCQFRVIVFCAVDFVLCEVPKGYLVVCEVFFLFGPEEEITVLM